MFSDTHLWQLIGSGFVLLLGALLQSTVGFGTGILSIPLLLWLNWRLPQAIAMMLPIIVLQTGYSCWRHRADIPWRAVGRFTVFRHLGLPFGMLSLRWLDASGRETVQATVGIIVLVALAANSLRQTRLHEVGWPGTAGAGILSGWLAGMVGMGAPPLVFWLLAHDWTRLRSQTFLWMTILSMIPAQMGLLIYDWGALAGKSILLGTALAPFGFVGSTIGLHLGRKLSQRRARQAMAGLLACVAVYSILEPWFARR